jgi:hypothetical protein
MLLAMGCPIDGHCKWLVGLSFHPSRSRLVRLYYVVDEALDPAHAVCTALRRAGGRRDREARGGVPVEAGQIEVQRILCDAIGRLRLVSCS